VCRLLGEDEGSVAQDVELARASWPDGGVESVLRELGRETRGPAVVAASDGAIQDLDAHPRQPRRCAGCCANPEHRGEADQSVPASVAAVSAEPIVESVARQRILDSAYDLFSRRGVRAVGIEEVIERAAVAKATLYRHFPSKDHLVLEFLRQRETVWTHGWVEAEARRRGATPEGRLLAIFDLFDEWFHREDFEGCSFINVMIETADPEHPIGRASAEHLENIRTVLRSLAEEAGLRDTEEFARSFHILMKGSIVQAAEGDVDAAKRAQQMAADLIEKYRE
jgi:AcrR family transcriptional regulator